jgi:hypothetical protein
MSDQTQKSKGGRPKNDIERRIVNVMLPLDLYEKLAKKCEESDTPLSTYIRQLIAKDVKED